jgi:hypothetical protein
MVNFKFAKFHCYQQIHLFLITPYKKIKCAHMKCHTNVNSSLPTQLPHKFSYTVAIFIHNHFESPNISNTKIERKSPSAN